MNVATRSPCFDAELLERLAQAVDALGDLAVGRTRDAVVAQGHDLAVGAQAPHAVEHVLQRQLVVVLHQAFEHLSSSPTAN